jgi:lipopolysaccharide biosynthesis glycosyltransferase
MRIYIGYDHRQPLAYNVCQHSIHRHASKAVDIQPLMLKKLPIKRRGLTDFTYSRYLIPYLDGYLGSALFLDADIIVRDDIFKLYEIVGEPISNSHLSEEQYAELPAVWVVKNKKVRFEWPSVMYFNNWKCNQLTLEYIETGSPQTFEWARKVGELPQEWNHCVGYDEPNDEAKIVHFTQGIPCWPETRDCEYADKWNEEFQHTNGTVSWADLMGNSVHAKPVLERLQRKTA